VISPTPACRARFRVPGNCRDDTSAVPQLEPGHRLPAVPSPAPPRGQPLHELKSATPFRLAAGQAQLRHPRPAPVGDLHPDDAARGSNYHGDRPAGSTRKAVPDAIAEKLTDQECRLSPAWMPRAEHPSHERASNSRTLRPPGKRHALPDRHPGHHRTRPSPAAPPRETSRAAGGRRDMHAQLRRERQADTTGPPRALVRGSSVVAAPSVAVRAKPTVPRTAPGHRFPSAIRPWIHGYNGTRRHKAARPGTDTKQPASQENPASGHIRSVWQVLGSNHRRLSRRFYSWAYRGMVAFA